MKYIATFFVILCTLQIGLGQQLTAEEEIKNLKEKINLLENNQANVKQSLENKFEAERLKLENESNQLEAKRDKEYRLIELLGIAGLSLNLLFIVGLLWSAKTYVEKKIKEKFDNIITEKEADILALINQQSTEKQLKNKKKILVHSSPNQEDTFIRKFFREMNFNVDHVQFTTDDQWKEPFAKYDVLFFNNDSNETDFAIIDRFCKESKPTQVIFYYNTTRKNYINPAVSNRLSFANAQPQIYGNLINLLRFQDLL